MADDIKIVDHILKNEGEGQYSVYFKELTEQDQQDIGQWLKNNFKYNDLKEAPALPNDDKAYNTHTENEEVVRDNIKPFHTSAFTGSYDDLIDAPTIPNVDGNRPIAFNEIAFTGRINASNLNITISNIIDLTRYESNIAGETGKLQTLGGENAVVKGIQDQLRTDIDSIILKFIQTKQPTFIISNSGIYFVLNVEKILKPNSDNVQSIKIDTIFIDSSSYNYISNITDAQINNNLNNLTLSQRHVCFISDWDNQLMYCKVDDLSSNGVDSSNLIINADQINGLENILDDVAFSGDYDDLNNIVKYPENVRLNITTQYHFYTTPKATLSELDNIVNPHNGDIYYVTSEDMAYIYNIENEIWEEYEQRLCFKGTVSTEEDLENIENNNIGDIYQLNNNSSYKRYNGERFVNFNLQWSITQVTLPEYYGKYAFSENIDYNDIVNASEIELKISDFIINTMSTQINKIMSFGKENSFFENINILENSNGAILKNEIILLANNYNILQKIKISSVYGGNYFVTNLKQFFDSNNNLQYIKIDYESEMKDNFELYTSGSYYSEEAAQQLDSLTISQTKGYMIFDCVHNVAFCKVL